jgi:hypothetical protein
VQYVGVSSAHQERNAQWHPPSGDSGPSS